MYLGLVAIKSKRFRMARYLLSTLRYERNDSNR